MLATDVHCKSINQSISFYITSDFYIPWIWKFTDLHQKFRIFKFQPALTYGDWGLGWREGKFWKNGGCGFKRVKDLSSYKWRAYVYIYIYPKFDNINLWILGKKDFLSYHWQSVNSLNAKNAIIQKPVNWFAEQINRLVSIW